MVAANAVDARKIVDTSETRTLPAKSMSPSCRPLSRMRGPLQSAYPPRSKQRVDGDIVAPFATD
jgi:hypothetical protein